MDKQILELDDEVRERMRPFVKELDLLDTIPGINMRTAEDIIAETGVDMNQFPTSAHFAAWAGICPGSRESAGKKKSSRTCDCQEKCDPLARKYLIHQRQEKSDPL